MKGSGCSRCNAIVSSKRKSLSRSDFIRKSLKVHGNRYDYSESQYVNNRIKVIIICPDHGKFHQKPNDHMLGIGCPLCKSSKGERAIMRWFDRWGIEFKHHHSFPDLMGDKRVT
jgi:hypothetical protein